MNENRELVDFEGKPRRQSVTPVVPRHGPSSPHTVLDVRFTPPHRITCKCGWATPGRSVLEIEMRWKAHIKEAAA